MDIGEVAKQTGLTPATLRYYEKFGLIESIGRNGLRRVFSDNVIEKLRLIILLKNNCFTLEEIREMSNRNQVDRQFLSVKTEQLKQKIHELTAVHNTLTHIINCPSANHFDCQRFQLLLHKNDVGK